MCGLQHLYPLLLVRLLPVPAGQTAEPLNLKRLSGFQQWSAVKQAHLTLANQET